MLLRYGLFAGSALSRLFAFAPNFSALGGLGLFAGSRMPFWEAALITLGPVLLVDLFRYGLYDPVSMLFNYAAFLMAPLVGRLLLSRKVSALRVGTGALSASLLFFLLSNFGVFASGAYGYSFAGLVDTYVLAIPFLQNTVASGLLFAAVLFGGAEAVKRLRLRDAGATMAPTR